MSDVTVTSPESSAALSPPVESNAAPSAPVETAPVQETVVAQTQETPVIADKPPEPTILGAEPVKPVGAEKPVDAPPADKPAEGDAADKPAEEPKKEEASQSDEPAPLPTYEAFTLPEGITFDSDKLTEFTKELAEFEVKNKADHAEVQAFGQKLMDRHIAEVQQTAERIQNLYTEAWEKQKSDWKEAFEKDPEIGGNRQQTSVNAAVEFIRTHGGSTEQQAEFRKLMDTTGIGNHPAMIRLFAKANTAFSEGKPLPATAPTQQSQSKVAKRYGQSQ